MDIRIALRARCFRGITRKGTLDTYRFLVSDDGTVRVFDLVAGHYTTLHGMTRREETRVRNRALKETR